MLVADYLYGSCAAGGSGQGESARFYRAAQPRPEKPVYLVKADNTMFIGNDR